MRGLGVTGIGVTGSWPWRHLAVFTEGGRKRFGKRHRGQRAFVSPIVILVACNGYRRVCWRCSVWLFAHRPILSHGTRRRGPTWLWYNNASSPYGASYRQILCDRETRASCTSRRSRHRAWTTWSARANAVQWQACNREAISGHPRGAGFRRCRDWRRF